MDIETILLEYEFAIGSLEFTNLISSCRILIEDPDIVNPEASIERDSKYVCLRKRKSKILTSHFPLRKKRKMSFFGYQHIRIHEEREELVTTLENSEFCGSTSRIFVYLEFRREDWFFVVLGESSWDDRLTRNIIDCIVKIRSQEIFYDSIFNRMK